MAQTHSFAEAKKILGIETFRGKQESCICRILTERKDTFGVMPTGTGKSACYQLPGLVLEGITVVVSPLLSLMQDQIDDLTRRGIHAASLSGRGLYAPLLVHGQLQGNEAWETVRTHADTLKFLYTTPETLRLRGTSFLELNIPLLVIDEAHCVSGWGMDFRPSYRVLRNFIARLETAGRRPIVAAFTATADEDVAADTIRMLGLRMAAEERMEWKQSLSNNVTRQVALYKTRRGKQNALRAFLLRHAMDKGIIFCGTKDAIPELRELLEGLEIEDLTCGEYYGGVRSEQAESARKNTMRAFREGKVRIMIATSAFGMGVNIPDVRYVVHYAFPSSMTDYIQQCGRAGRDGKGADCLLLADVEDFETLYPAIAKRPLLMYSRPYAARIREQSLANFRDLFDHCLEQNQNKAARPYFQLCREKAWPSGAAKRPQDGVDVREAAGDAQSVVINGSADLRRRVWNGEVSFYEAILADGVYTLWYRGRDSFTLRELACLISGNPEFVFRGGRSKGSARKEEMRQGLEHLTSQRLLPIEEEPGSKWGRYVFSRPAKDNLPWEFPLQEAAAAEDTLYSLPGRLLEKLRGRPEAGSKGGVKDTREYLIVRYYLLHELARMALTPTSRRIIYSRRPHRAGAGETIGLLHVYDFFPSDMTASNRRKKEKHIHEMVCGVLDILKQAGLIDDFRELTISDLKSGDLRDGKGLRVDGRQVRGVELQANLTRYSTESAKLFE